MAKRKGMYLSVGPEDYPGAQPSPDSVKAPRKERNQRGKFQGNGIEGTAARAVAHMQATKPRGNTYGASEAHARAAARGDNRPTGSFAKSPPTRKRR